MFNGIDNILFGHKIILHNHVWWCEKLKRKGNAVQMPKEYNLVKLHFTIQESANYRRLYVPMTNKLCTVLAFNTIQSFVDKKW